MSAGQPGGWQFLPSILIRRSDGAGDIRDPSLPGSVVLASLVLNLLGLALPLCILQIYDRILPNEATETLAFLIFGLTLVIVLDATLKMVRARIINWVAGAFTFNASVEAFRRLIKAKPAQIDALPVSVHMNRLNALTALGDFYGGPSRLLLIDVPAASIYLIIMGLIGGWIVLVPIVLLALFSFLALRRNQDLRDIVAQRSDHDNRKYDFVAEILSGIHTVKSMAMEPLMLRRFERLQAQVERLSFRSILVANSAQSTASLYSMLSTISVVTVGALLAIAADLSVGVVAACTLLSGQLVQPLMRGINAWADLQNTRHNFDQAMKLFDLPPAQMGATARPEAIKDFTLEDVCYEDEKLGRTVVEDFSLACAPGEIIGLRSWEAGERQALAQILRGYETPATGRILYNGKDINAPEHAGLRDGIVYAGSSPVIFQGSILENLTVFGQRADANKARRMAELFGLEEEIHLLPNGYETKLGQGVNEEIPRSTIQWINLVRAVAADPKVLILDSFTQPLDENATQKTLQALASLKKSMVIIVLSQFDTDLAIADRCFDIWGGQLLPSSNTAAAAGSPAPAPAESAAAEEAGEQDSGSPVHAQLKELEAKLSAAQQAGEEERIPPAQACLDPLLMWLGWHGVGRHLYEALPHADQIATLEDLRAVLVRLNYRTEPQPIRLGAIDRDTLPCLFVSGEKIHVLLGFEEDDTLSVFDSETQEFTELNDPSLHGTAYFLTPIDVEEERKALRKHSWLTGVMARFKRLLYLIFGLGLVTNIFALALPIYVMTVYDRAIGTDSPRVLLALTTGMLLVLTIDLMLRRIRGQAQAYFGSRLDALVGNNAFSQLLHMPVGMTESTPIGGQITRLRQFESIREVFTGPLASALIDVPFVFVFIAAIAVIAGPLAWIPVILVAAYGLISAVAIPLIRHHVGQAGELKSKQQNLMMEALVHQRGIRDIAAEGVWVEKFEKLSEDFALKNLQTRALTFNTQTISQTLMLIAGVSTLGVGTLLALEGSLSAGALIAAMALSWRVLNPLNQAFVSLTRLGQMLQSLEQVNKLMRLQVERVPNLLPAVYRSFQGRLDVRRLIFTYPSNNEPVLRGLSFTVEPGEIVAITGTSGGGKSTVLKIMLGLYPVQAGAILADGRDIRQLDPGEWRHAISYAPKFCNLFYGTLGQNLTLANPTATNVEVSAALEKAGVLDVEFEEFLPEGVETRLTGQRIGAMPDDMKQRIVLARALVKKSPFYLFDSPAQNLSPSGIERFLSALNELRGKSTVILVTQRPEVIRAADRVLQIRNGQVAWDGAPEIFIEQISKAA